MKLKEKKQSRKKKKNMNDPVSKTISNQCS